MSRTRYGIPENPRLFKAQVKESRRLSPSFQRVTVESKALADFSWQREDHWFRLFLPRPESPQVLPLPDNIEGPQWWPRLKRVPEQERPHVANYSVADFNVVDGKGVMDIDVVLHADEAGEFSAPVAAWAVTTTPGSPLGMLDQGIIYLPPQDTTNVIIATDESGLPGVRQVVKGLPSEADGTVVIEVASHDDIEAWDAPTGLDVRWLVRSYQDRPGTLAVTAIEELENVPATAYAYLVGESKLATGTRRALVKKGLGKDRITFSGFWRHD